MEHTNNNIPSNTGQDSSAQNGFAFDLCELETIDRKLPLEALKTLLDDRPLVLDLPLEGDRAELGLQVRRGLFAREDTRLALGFPLLAVTDTEIYPLFVWPVEGAREEAGKLVIEFSVRGPELCTAFAQWMADRHETDLQALANGQIEANGGDHKKSLFQLVGTLCDQLGLEGRGKKLQLGRLLPAPTPKSVQWSSVLSHWQSGGPVHKKIAKISLPEPERENALRPTALSESPEPTAEENAAPQAPVPAFPVWQFPVSPIALAPPQAELLEALQRSSAVLVEGPDKSGKTHALSAAAVQALLNGGSIVLASDSPAALDHIEKNLSDIGLADLLLVVRDADLDRQPLLDRLRELPNAVRKKSVYDEGHYKIKLRPARRSIEKLRSAHRALYAPVSEGLTWQEWTGLYLSAQSEEAHQLLSSKVTQKEFPHFRRDMEELCRLVSEQQRLLGALGTMHHPLGALDDDVVLKNTAEAGGKKVSAQLSALRSQLASALRRLLVATEDFAEYQRNGYLAYCDRFRRKSRRIRQDIQDYSDEYGAEFTDTGTLQQAKMAIFGGFSTRLGEIKLLREEVSRNFDELQEDFKKNRYFEHKFVSVKGKIHFDKIMEGLFEFEGSMNEWERNLPVLVREEIKRLNSQTIVADPVLKQQIASTSSEVLEAMGQLQRATFFRNPPQYRSDSNFFKAMREWMESRLVELDNCLYAMRDFQHYHAWRKHWLSLDDRSRQLVEALWSSKPESWSKAVESWCYHQLLAHKIDLELPANHTDWKGLFADIGALRQVLPERILHLANGRRDAALKALSGKSSSDHKKLVGPKNTVQLGNESLAAILAVSPATITECFPIVLVATDLAQDVFDGWPDRCVDAVLLDIEEPGSAHLDYLRRLGKQLAMACRPVKGRLTMAALAGGDGFETLNFSQGYLSDSSAAAQAGSDSPCRDQFVQQLSDRLSAFVDKKRIRRSTVFEGVPVDLLIVPAGKGLPTIAVFFDGAFRNPSPGSSEWTWSGMEKLKNDGCTVLVSWSLDCWRNPEGEVGRLAAAILQHSKKAVEPEA